MVRNFKNHLDNTLEFISESESSAFEEAPKELQAQIRISLVADFDPFQAGSLEADPDIFTQQFSHIGKKGRKSSDRMGWLANEVQAGLDQYYESKTNSSHSIFTFFNDISKLKEGTYKWDGSKWVQQ